MAEFGITERLARTSARRPWIVIGLWVAVFAAGLLFASGVGDVLTSDISLTNNPESTQADNLIEDRLRGPEQATESVIVVSETATVDDAEFEAFVGDLLTEIRGLDGLVAQATSFYEVGDPALVPADRDTTILPVVLAYDDSDATDEIEPLVDLVKEADEAEGFDVLTAGNASINHEANEISEKDVQRGEMIGIPVALIILILVFGAVLAAGIPLLMAVVSIAIATGIVALIGEAFELNFMVVNFITMIGLAVGIDYSLFIVHRYREERKVGLGKQEAIEKAGATSSRAVLFSGGTVVVGLMGMFIIPGSVYRSLAAGAVTVAIVSVLAALTLLPAVLSILGDKIDALRLPFFGRGEDDEGSFWGRSARFVMARPIISIVAVVGLLLAAAIPYFTIETGLPGVSTFPESSDSRAAFEILAEDFSAGLLSPTEIVIDAEDVSDPSIQAGIERLTATLADDPIFGPVTTGTNEAGDLEVLSVLIAADPFEGAAYAAIDRLRGDYIPAAFAGVDANIVVGGDTAIADDMFDMVAEYTPIVFAFVLGLSFFLLLVVFRSIVVPIKALIMNLLSVGATYGMLVLVFQHGVGNEILGLRQTEMIAAWLPLFLFAVLFGLSMDYHVFLLSRIRERFDQTDDNHESVAFGVRNTAGIITGAAAIMVAVFSGFAMGDLVDLQQFGFGLGLAVLLDATIIRSVLVPSSMALLGDWNWYLPKWLEWLPDVRVEGGSAVESRKAPSEAMAAAGD
ncbi:MAG: MMPL family transporter [Dehalococcoidia bacterium]